MPLTNSSIHSSPSNTHRYSQAALSLSSRSKTCKPTQAHNLLPHPLDVPHRRRRTGETPPRPKKKTPQPLLNPFFRSTKRSTATTVWWWSGDGDKEREKDGQRRWRQHRHTRRQHRHTRRRRFPARPANGGGAATAVVVFIVVFSFGCFGSRMVQTSGQISVLLRLVLCLVRSRRSTIRISIRLGPAMVMSVQRSPSSSLVLSVGSVYNRLIRVSMVLG
ncbi:hypothetical protein Hdeb2414_s0018g00531651 [Helianthus debilis subsp. tardiflorus]